MKRSWTCLIQVIRGMDMGKVLTKKNSQWSRHKSDEYQYCLSMVVNISFLMIHY